MDANHQRAEEYLAGFAAAAKLAKDAAERRGKLYPIVNLPFVSGVLRTIELGEWTRGLRDGLASGFGF